MFRTGLAAVVAALLATSALGEGMLPAEPIPEVVLEETAGGFTSGLVVVVVLIGLFAVLDPAGGSGSGNGSFEPPS